MALERRRIGKTEKNLELMHVDIPDALWDDLAAAGPARRPSGAPPVGG